MKKEINFITKYEQEQKQLEELEKTLSKTEPPCRAESIERYFSELANLETSQYEITKDKERYHFWTKIIYQNLSDTAEAQGGKISLDIDEENLTGNLIYFGHKLVFNDLCGNKRLLSQMITLSEDFYIEPKEDMIELVFSFRLYHTKKIADHSEAIAYLKAHRCDEPVTPQ